MKEQIEIPSDMVDFRLDKAVKMLFDVPWATARSWIQKGKICIDGDVCVELDKTVSDGNVLTYREDAKKPKSEARLDASCILYIDTHVIVAHKPHNILTVPFEKGDKGTFDQQLRTYLARTLPKPEKRRGALPPLMVVHRLDKGTSGVMVFARTWTAKEGLAKQFRDHSIFRKYTALVHGKPQTKTIRTHLLADRGDGIRGSSESSPHGKVRRSGKGQLAITHVTVEEQYSHGALISCTLDTGRTNQIRIHLSEEGNPLVGETVYMRGFKGGRISSERLMLHATELQFIHPVTGKKMKFTSPLPEAFKGMIKRLISSSE